MRRLRLPTLYVALATGLIGAGCSKPAPDAMFIIVVDTLRPDRLSCYGETAFATPGIDALANAGVRFDRAQSVASWTIPSMGAMFTSLYPTQLGLVEQPVLPSTPFEWRQRRKQRAYTIAYEEETLAELMSEAGYRTAAFVNQPGLNAADGFAQGFDDYFYPVDTETIGRLAPDKPLITKRWPPFLRAALSIDTKLTEALDGWLSENHGEKMFVWIHLLTPHSPYSPPTWARERVTTPHKGRSAESNAYDGEVVAVDDLVASIVKSIDTHIGVDRSVVVFTSDHGEAFGEHDMTGHGHALYNEVLNVPLIVRAPGTPAGTAVGTTVRTIDIMPTVLELAGVEVRGDSDFMGSSLVPLFGGNAGERMVYAEGMLYGSTERALIVGGKKLMFDMLEPGNRLFDATSDPYDLHDMHSSHPAIADSLRKALDNFYADLAEDYLRRLTPNRSGEETEQIRNALKSLGYMGGDE